MTKIKIKVIVERNGKEWYETPPLFAFGYKEECSEEQHIEIANTVITEFLNAFHAGVRLQAGSRGIKIWPMEG